ncbi:ABC transporter permease [Sulfuricurvum sp.]|uniref:ABC transporter permease n=1 Tax=Sulfuricurvum sp. TaxID=2025608 RepID=UPI003BAFAB3C
MILLKMALRELITYKKRSVVTLLLSTFATALFIFVDALHNGSHDQLVRSSVEVYPGYLQVTNRAFEDNPNFDNLIFDADKVKQELSGVNGLGVITERFESYALYSTDEQSIGGMFTAIEPENEAEVSRLKRSLVAGEYLSSEDTNALYLGVELAKRLGVGIGDTLSFISTGADYSFAADNLVVKGLFKTKLYEFDNGAGFVNKKYFDEVMHSGNIATHIIANPDDIAQIDAVTVYAQNAVGNTLEVKNYKTTMEDLILAMDIDAIFGYITLGIFFIVIFFVIGIFAFLSVYGRIRQIGILRAIGTTPAQVMGMLLIETLILGVLSVGIGGGAGGYASSYYEKHPIELTSLADVDAEEYGKQYNIVAETNFPAEYNPSRIMAEMLIMMLLNLLTVIYPIAMINRFTPTEAIRYV